MALLTPGTYGAPWGTAPPGGETSQTADCSAAASGAVRREPAGGWRARVRRNAKLKQAAPTHQPLHQGRVVAALAASHRVVQRHPAAVVDGVNVGARFHQRHARWGRTRSAGDVQRRAAIRVLSVHLRAGLQQQAQLRGASRGGLVLGSGRVRRLAHHTCSVLPFAAAQWRGVRPAQSFAVTSALWDSSAWREDTCRFRSPHTCFGGARTRRAP